MTSPGFTTRPELTGSFGMVASTHYLASAVGMSMLETGGTAVDAAVAAGFTLQVVEPHLNGPGGDLTLLFAGADAVPRVLAGQGPAPAAATPQAMLDRGLGMVPGAGVTAAAVPASTVAWLTLLRDHGTRSVEDVLAAAIHYATTGFPVLPAIHRTIAAVSELFRAEWSGSAEQYLGGGAAPRVGEMLTNQQQARTYRLMVEAAAGRSREAGIDAAIECWTTGFVAEAIAAFCRTEQADGSGGRYRGFITEDDLASLQVPYEDAVTAEIDGWTVAKAGPWTQGPVLLQQLRLIDGMGLGTADCPPGSAEWIHRVTEVSKLAFADRDAWYGDVPQGAAGATPLATLLSEQYTAERRTLIGGQASLELLAGSPDGRTPVLPDWDIARRGPGNAHPAAATGGDPTVSRTGENRGDTCHVSVVDSSGTMVAATPSGGWLQSSPLIPALGFPLGTRLQMTTLEPGLPASLVPGRRPRSTLSPSLAAHRDGRRLAFGTPGGDQQDQWQFGFLLNHLLGGMNLQEAIDAPAFHSTHFPSSFHPREAFPGQIVIEDRVGDDVLAELERRGHDVVRSGPWSLGRMSAVSRSADGRVLRSAANPRGMQGYAVGR